jgi:hypothetical protein
MFFEILDNELLALLAFPEKKKKKSFHSFYILYYCVEQGEFESRTSPSTPSSSIIRDAVKRP